jgi:hypothetical protein
MSPDGDMLEKIYPANAGAILKFQLHAVRGTCFIMASALPETLFYQDSVRENELDRCYGFTLRFHPDFSAVTLCDTLGNRQSDPSSRKISLLMDALEWVEYIFGIDHVKPRPVIAHKKKRLTILLDLPKVDARLECFPHELDRAHRSRCSRSFPCCLKGWLAALKLFMYSCTGSVDYQEAFTKILGSGRAIPLNPTFSSGTNRSIFHHVIMMINTGPEARLASA